MYFLTSLTAQCNCQLRSCARQTNASTRNNKHILCFTPSTYFVALKEISSHLGLITHQTMLLKNQVYQDLSPCKRKELVDMY